MFVDEKAAGEAQTAEQANRTLKLSEAIRIGAKIRGQCKTFPFNQDRSCALGAAYEAVYGAPDGADGTLHMSDVSAPILAAFPFLNSPSVLMRDGPMKSDRLMDDVWRLNDQLGKSREQIADWLEAQGY